MDTMCPESPLVTFLWHFFTPSIGGRLLYFICVFIFILKANTASPSSEPSPHHPLSTVNNNEPPCYVLLLLLLLTSDATVAASRWPISKHGDIGRKCRRPEYWRNQEGAFGVCHFALLPVPTSSACFKCCLGLGYWVTFFFASFLSVAVLVFVRMRAYSTIIFTIEKSTGHPLK